MNRVTTYVHLLTIVLISFILKGCSYSFTGASISPEIKTVQIDFFPNKASIVQPSLSQTFTEKLRDRFVSQTNLELVTERGDLVFEGAITDYFAQPKAIQGTDQAALNRLTITIRVKYTNKQDDTKNFESVFSRYADYSANQNLAAIEIELIDIISEQLVTDIFNRSVVNW